MSKSKGNGIKPAVLVAIYGVDAYRYYFLSDVRFGADGGISIMDQSLGINWKIPTDQALLSEKDTKHQMLVNFDSPFNINTNLYIESETR